ncbi:rhotekin-2 isoform X1 [Coregonus clupeaformis]|uniref:rhotekin-2 isoform X1 n=1 Tax=Coregonus clupeaformis TaxID=59861 RepID=UPI001BE0AD73|nr:rhotekin-2 isoform X1 [Coregonus clupeaformis]
MANMDYQREVQNFRRNASARSSCSSLAMEIKRKKIRENTVFLQSEDTNMQEKIDFEIRMRDGAYKLLVASTNREQILNASKNLLTCNTRIKAYMTEMHKKEDHDMRVASRRRLSDRISNDHMACRGKVALSGLRIPLMWKDSDHFNNKGSSRRVAIFCLMRIGSEVFDTEMVVVDRSMTDVCFEGVTVFNDVGPAFELKVELYSCAIEEETTLVNTPKKLAKKFRSSFGRASGRKLCPLLEAGDPDAFLQSNPIPLGARYSLLAYTSLGLAWADGGFQSHSLIVLQDAESSSWLPLYGNLCCRLVAQPICMTQDMMNGYLIQQQSVEGLSRCCSLYCVLRAGTLFCYYTPEEITAKVEPSLIIPINKDTRIRVVDKGPQKRSNSLTITNPVVGGALTNVFTTDSREELEDWMEAFWQHFYDQSQWQHCCSELMKIEVTSPKKPPLFLTKQADSVYNDLSINSPGKFESITDIIHNKIEETGGRFLIGEEEAREPPKWSTLFDGSLPMVVQKSVLSPGKESPCPSPTPSSSSVSNGNKKRRAPPPPADKQPYGFPPARPPPPYQEKDNVGAGARTKTGTKTGRPSLDAKFSAIIQQLQRNPGGLSRKNAPLGQMEPPQLELEYPQTPDVPPRPAPVPAPRNKLRKSLREKMNPKAW